MNFLIFGRLFVFFWEVIVLFFEVLFGVLGWMGLFWWFKDFEVVLGCFIFWVVVFELSDLFVYFGWFWLEGKVVLLFFFFMFIVWDFFVFVLFWDLIGFLLDVKKFGLRLNNGEFENGIFRLGFCCFWIFKFLFFKLLKL